MTENSLTSKLRLWFSLIASRSAEAMGSALAFAIATLSVVAWAVSGPFFHYSDTWQLVINTGTTVLTFLAVFLIQHSQNRDGRAIQLKLDELIRSHRFARNHLIDLEHCTDDEIEELQAEFERFVSRRKTERPSGTLPRQHARLAKDAAR